VSRCRCHVAGAGAGVTVALPLGPAHHRGVEGVSTQLRGLHIQNQMSGK